MQKKLTFVMVAVVLTASIFAPTAARGELMSDEPASGAVEANGNTLIDDPSLPLTPFSDSAFPDEDAKHYYGISKQSVQNEANRGGVELEFGPDGEVVGSIVIVDPDPFIAMQFGVENLADEDATLMINMFAPIQTLSGPTSQRSYLSIRAEDTNNDDVINIRPGGPGMWLPSVFDDQGTGTGLITQGFAPITDATPVVSDFGIVNGPDSDSLGGSTFEHLAATLDLIISPGDTVFVDAFIGLVEQGAPFPDIPDISTLREVPEPSSGLLLSLAGLALFRRRRRRAKRGSAL